MRVLMVTPYPPVRDGIAAYAVQTVESMRAAGHDVEVLSPGPSAAHHHLDLVGPRGALALARRVRGYDRVIVQFHPDVFYPVPSSIRDRIAEDLALTAAFRACRAVEVRVHEIDYRRGRLTGPEGISTRLLWRSVDRVVVHTETERADFASAFGVPLRRVEVAAHGADFSRRTTFTRAQARESLGLPAGEFIFLAIGFIQPHKGFDRAVRAFAGLGGHGARLDIVGSVRVDEPAYLSHLEELQALVDATAGAHLHLGYVSDELFDRWLVACDAVVLPYRSIWSSGVLERAALYGRPVIATRVGGLGEQAGRRADVTLVADDDELRAAMWAAAGAGGPVVQAAPWPVEAADLRDAVQSEVRRRAAQRRGAPLAAVAVDARAESRLGVSVPVRRLRPLALPPPTSHRAEAAFVKRAVRRLTAWELEPVIGQINALQSATIAALERLAQITPPEQS